MTALAGRCAPNGRARRARPSTARVPRCMTRVAPAPRPWRSRSADAVASTKRRVSPFGRHTSITSAGSVQLAAQPFRDRCQRRVDVAFAEQPDHVVQHHRLALALLGLARSLALPRRQLAGDRRRQQEEQQRHPLARVADRELVTRLDKEPVEHQESARSTQRSPGRGRTATAVAITASRYSMDTLARFTWPSTRPMKTLSSATAASAKAYPNHGASPAAQKRHRRSDADHARSITRSARLFD